MRVPEIEYKYYIDNSYRKKCLPETIKSLISVNESLTKYHAKIHSFARVVAHIEGIELRR